MRRSGSGYLGFLFFARSNNTKTGFAGEPFFRILFFRCPLAFDLTLFCLSLFSHAITPAFVPGIANYMIRVSFGTEALADAKLVGCVPQNFTPHRKKQAECEKECFLLVPKRLGD